MNKITNCVAGAGLCLPAWWPSLDQASTVAAQMVPILSALWLLIQILAWAKRQVRRDNHETD